MSQQINLFNTQLLKQRKLVSAVDIARVLGGVVVVAVLLAAYGAWTSSQLQRQVKAGEASLAERVARLEQVNRDFPPREKNKELEATVQRMQAELAALRAAQAIIERGDLGNRAGYSEYFRAFARQRVDGVWLTGVTLAGPGNDIGVQGRALRPELVPGYIQKLTREAVLQGKGFASVEIGRPAAEHEKAVAPFVEFRLLSRIPEAKP